MNGMKLRRIDPAHPDRLVCELTRILDSILSTRINSALLTNEYFHYLTVCEDEANKDESSTMYGIFADLGNENAAEPVQVGMIGISNGRRMLYDLSLDMGMYDHITCAFMESIFKGLRTEPVSLVAVIKSPGQHLTKSGQIKQGPISPSAPKNVVTVYDKLLAAYGCFAKDDADALTNDLFIGIPISQIIDIDGLTNKYGNIMACAGNPFDGKHKLLAVEVPDRLILKGNMDALALQFARYSKTAWKNIFKNVNGKHANFALIPYISKNDIVMEHTLTADDKKEEGADDSN